MDVTQRILENVRKQGATSQRLKNLQEEADRHSEEMTKLSGQMELLGEMFAEEHDGVSLQEFMNANPEFKQQLVDANKAGASLVDGVSQKPQPAPLRPTKAHAGNKQIGPRPIAPGSETPQAEPHAPVDGGKNSETEQVRSIRMRQPPQVVVTDEPPPGPGDDTEDDE